MRTSGAPFIVGMRAVLQVSEAFRYESSFKTVLPPIGAVAPVTSVPAVCYAALNKKLLPQKDFPEKRAFIKSAFDLSPHMM